MKKLMLTFTMMMGVSMLAFAQLPSMGKADLGDLMGQFAKEGLDKDAVSKDFDANAFADKAKGMSDLGEIGGHINTLIGAIKPGMFKDGVDVDALKEAGSSLKSVADATGLMDKLQSSLLKKAFKKKWDPGKFSKALGLLG